MDYPDMPIGIYAHCPLCEDLGEFDPACALCHYGWMSCDFQLEEINPEVILWAWQEDDRTWSSSRPDCDKVMIISRREDVPPDIVKLVDDLP